MCRIHDERVHRVRAALTLTANQLLFDATAESQTPFTIQKTRSARQTYSYAFSVRWTFGFRSFFFLSIVRCWVYTFGHQFYDFFITHKYLYSFFGCQSQFNSISFVKNAVRTIKVMIIDNYNTNNIPAHNPCGANRRIKRRPLSASICIDSLAANRHDLSIIILLLFLWLLLSLYTNCEEHNSNHNRYRLRCEREETNEKKKKQEAAMSCRVRSKREHFCWFRTHILDRIKTIVNKHRAHTLSAHTFTQFIMFIISLIFLLTSILLT